MGSVGDFSVALALGRREPGKFQMISASMTSYYGFTDTSELPLLDETIGQERAVEALKLGLEIKSLGFNGFFESCNWRGLTGQQGVVIPARNSKHLALRRDTVEAVSAGQFSIYAANTAAEALELLTGLPAGEPGADDEYPPDSLYGRAARRLAEMAEKAAAWKEHETRIKE